MKLARSLVVVLFFWAVVAGPSASAQFSKLDDLSSDFANKLKHKKAKSIIVENLKNTDLSVSGPGEYFASVVAQYLKDKDRKLTVGVRTPAKLKLPTETPASEHNLPSEPTSNSEPELVSPEYLLTGTVETSPETYALHILVRKINDNSLLLEKSLVLERTEFTDSLSQTFPPQTDYPVLNTMQPKSGVDSKRMPTCQHCPYPTYNDQARAAHAQGHCVFDVLISGDGRVVAAQLAKSLGYGLDQQAFNAMKKWRFNPATDMQGKPIASIVAIEVTFQLY